MKKIFQKIVLSVLCCALVLGAAGCADDERTGGTIDVKLDEYHYEGTHVYNVKSTGKSIIKNGNSFYTIVYPADCGELVMTAVNEIISILALSTEVQLMALPDDSVSYSSTGRYISVGNTTLAEAAGVSGEDVAEAGFIIKTVGDSVYLVGGDDHGTLNSVYEFLYRTIDFRTYYSDVYHYDKRDTVELLDFDVKDVPDFTYRLRNYGVLDSDEAYSNRMRLVSPSDIWIPVGGNYWHNALDYLPSENYPDKADKWYSADGKQLCFNAHGIESEWQEMYGEILKKAKECVDSYPTLHNITFTQMDGAYWCKCDACNAEIAKYGTGAPAIIRICNKLAEDLNNYLAGTGRVINVCLFAYGSSSTAPAVKNADGSYSPIDESCVCGENVYVFCAPQNADYRYSAFDPKSIWSENAKAWASLTEQMYFWVYSTNFDNYMMPYNTFDAMQGNYQFMKSVGANYVFDQSQWNQKIGPGWSLLKMWLNSKLTWNVNLDFNALLDEFFANVYLDAEEPMREMFEMYRMHMRYIQSRYDIEKGTNVNLLKSEYWPKAWLDQVLAKADEAYKAIEPLKKRDPEMYDAVYDRICLETISFRYIDISLYNGLKDSQKQLADKKQFKLDTERLGLTLFNELNSINTLWSTWGLL